MTTSTTRHLRDETPKPYKPARLDVTGEARCADDFRQAEDHLGFAKDSFLRRRGWAMTSDSPGSYCLWAKVIDGVGYRGVSCDMAIAMEASIEAAQCRCCEDSADGCPLHGDDE